MSWKCFYGCNNTESREVSLNGNVYDFSLDYNFIDKSDIINIHQYLMTKNNNFLIIKTCFNSKQKWNNKTCQCECKNYQKCEKDYSWNPSI